MTERELFFAALDHDAPADRAAYLDRACGGDPALRRRVEALLVSHATAGEFLDTPAAEQVAGNGGGSLDFLAPSQRPDALGRLGHYEVLEVVSRGGTGVVFRAFDDKLQRVVAIKALAPQLVPGGAARQRFVREARAAAAVTHDNVIAIHAVEDAGPVPYLVMQFIDGPTLQQKLDRAGRLSASEVLRIGMQVAEGLAAAHKQGLIHRDVKPANILLENGVERVKLTDFGLARAGDDATPTEPGVVAGTPMYMSPEQAEGRPVDFRSDLFSLGGVLYAMCTGQPPFRGPTTGAVLRRVSDEASQPIREINPETPDDLCAVIARLQAKNPADRFQTAAEVADVLGRQLARLQQPAPDSPGPRGRLRAFLSPGVFVALPAAVLALVGGLAGYLNSRDPGTSPPAVAEPIRVGVLHSQTGTMGSSESAAIDATLLAIDEINQAGGLLGRPVLPVVVDGMSDWPTYAREAERLIAAERVCTIFGCWTSASRKAVTPVVERHDHLLVYPMQYEGFEQSPCVVYTGAVPNQQVTPAVRWCVEHLGKRFFIVGSDYVWPRATGEVIRDQLAELGGEIVGEAYLPMETAAVQAVVRQVVQAKPDVILEMVAGDSKVAYYRAMRQAGVTPDKVPSLSFSSPQPGLAARDVAGDYAAWNYFEGIDSPANRAFVARFRARFGPQRVLSDPMEASYLGVHLWAQAVRDAGRDDAAAIRRALHAQRYQAPEGEVRIDPQTQHLWKTPRVARMTDTGAAEVVWSAPEPVRPVPFPPSRTREQWQRLLADLHRSWGGQWSAPAPAWERAVAALPAEKQVEAVAQRLRELNPRFDDKVTETIENGTVTGLRFLADDVDDISPVRAFRKLRTLEFRRSTLTEAKLSDLSPLRGLPLEHLVFGRDRVADLEPLRGMPLRDLVCADTPVSDLSPLKGMPLASLNCTGSKVADLTPLQGMPLTRLDCAATAVSDLTPLKGMPLRQLACGFCPRVSDLSPLRGMPLRNLDITESGVSDLSPLKGMTLANLDLYHAKQVKDLSPLREVTVESLNLGGVPVTDLSPLTGMTALRALILSDSPATDLSPLKGLPLTMLDVRNTNVSDLTPLEGMPLRQLTLTFHAERDTKVLESLKSLEQINGKPVAEFWQEQSQQP